MVISKGIEKIPFLITGSYAHFIHDKENSHFSFSSDIDVSVDCNSFYLALEKLSSFLGAYPSKHKDLGNVFSTDQYLPIHLIPRFNKINKKKLFYFLEIGKD